ncbi:unnamed protein product [Linum tenue]|uniref:Cell wall hydroxyproline-rich glycoprotein n=1 Tax=Linum tenue TaxID=586396 RepID=A0AAV0HKU6_9ROSI|nr:unnamed protein product [Linum tenue]
MPSYSSTYAQAACSFLFLLLLLNPNFSNKATAKHTHSSSSTHHHRQRPAAATNPRLHSAYLALQAWKRVIYSDPSNYTSNWAGPSVCSYNGVYCTASVDDPETQVVAGIDLNHLDIAGFLPDELGLLADLALVHINSNRFCGIVPQAISNLTLLHELDLSNNRFVGPFPSPLFGMGLDAIFVNNNRFTSTISSTTLNGTGGASVLVFANNRFNGCLPPTISQFADTLEELLLVNSSLQGCLPPEVGYLYKLRLLDVSRNGLVGPVPYSLAGLAHLEVLNLGHNLMTGIVPGGVCVLPRLDNFTFSYNFFCEEEGACVNLTSRGRVRFDDRRNCLPEKPLQRSKELCDIVAEHPVDCGQRCTGGSAAGFVDGGGALAPFLAPAVAPGPT